MNRFLWNWSHTVNSTWLGCTNTNRFVLQVPFYNKIPMVITGHKITKYGNVEFYGSFVSEKEPEPYNRNGTNTTPTPRNKGLRDLE